MFGRLGLSVEDARKQYVAILNEAFSEKKHFSSAETFKAHKLEEAVKKMLVQCGERPDARMVDTGATEGDRCKVSVMTSYTLTASPPKLTGRSA